MDKNLTYYKELPGGFTWLKKACLVLLLITFTSCLFMVSLNYSGFCIREMRYLTDIEKFEAVFNAANRRRFVYLDNEAKTVDFLPYKSFEEYYKLYPDCCAVNPGGGYDVPPHSLTDRLLGRESGDVIVIRFYIQYSDKGQLREGEAKIESVLTNCGDRLVH